MRELLRRKQAAEALALHTTRLQALLDLHLLQQASQEQILDFVLDAAIKTMQSEYAFIGLMDEAESIMTIHRWSDKAMAQCAMTDNPILFPVAEGGLWGDCVRQRKALLVNDYQAPHPGKKGLPAGHTPIRRFLAVPVLDEGRTVAVAAVANKGKDYTEDDVSAFTSLFNKMWELLRRKQAEKLLRESEERHRTILQTAMDGFWRADLQGRLLEVNEAYCQMSGYSEQELLAINIRDIEATETLADTDARMQKIIAQGEDRFETRHRRKDGSIFEVEVSVQYKPTERGLLVAFLRDITERKKAEELLHQAYYELERRVKERTADLERANEALQLSEENLRFLTSKILSVQEKERKRIAYELHDGLGQSLAVLKLQLRAIQRMMPQTGREKDKLESTLNYLNELIENVRRISKALSPALLEDLGLPAGLMQLFEETCKLQGIGCSFNIDDVDALFSFEDKIIIYRMFQAILSNITKHAKATQIELGIQRLDGRVQFSVSDNGIGFNIDQTLGRSIKERGMGLGYMEEQARMLGGALNIMSKEWKGTRINITVSFSGNKGV
jgi:PAS domain S-box-containing protein